MILKRNEKYGIECGVSEGWLYLGDDESGESLPDTPANRKLVLREFDRTVRRTEFPRGGDE